MRALPVALFAALLAAGCVSTQAPAADLKGASADLALLGPSAYAMGGALLPGAPMPTLRGAELPIPGPSGEPTLGINAKGTIFMNGFTSGDKANQPAVFRSRDHGLSWTEVTPKLPTGDRNPPFTFDPYLYLDRTTGRVWHNTNTLECAWVSYSDDEGASWTTSPIACGLAAKLADHQSMVAGKPRMLTPVGYPNIVYSCHNTGQDQECASSLNGGISFGPSVPVFPNAGDPQGCGGGILDHPVNDKDGRVYLAHRGCNDAPEIAVTENDGLTWTSHVISKTTQQDPQILMHDVALATDDAGNVYAAWIAKDGLPYLSFSKDHGATWSAAKRASPPHVTAGMVPALAAGAEGRVVLAWIGSDIEGGYGSKPIGRVGTVDDLTPPGEPHEWDNATWHAYLTIMTDATSENATAYTVTANDPSDPVARGSCGKTRCGGMDDFIDAAIDPDGRPYAAFVDVCDKKCVDDPTIHKSGNVGFVGTTLDGFALRGPAGALLPTLVVG